MPQTWEWAVEMYSGTSMKAVDIARALGISRPLLSYRGPVCDSCGAIINPFLVAS